MTTYCIPSFIRDDWTFPSPEFLETQKLATESRIVDETQWFWKLQVQIVRDGEALGPTMLKSGIVTLPLFGPNQSAVFSIATQYSIANNLNRRIARFVQNNDRELSSDAELLPDWDLLGQEFNVINWVYSDGISDRRATEQPIAADLMSPHDIPIRLARNWKIALPDLAEEDIVVVLRETLVTLTQQNI